MNEASPVNESKYFASLSDILDHSLFGQRVNNK